MFDEFGIAEGEHRLVAEAGEILIDVGRADIDAGRGGIVDAGEKLVEIGGQRSALAGEVERGAVGRVSEAAADGGVADIGRHRLAAIELLEPADCGRGTLTGRGDERDVAGKTAQDRRAALRDQIGDGQGPRVRPFDHAGPAGDGGHRGQPTAASRCCLCAISC